MRACPIRSRFFPVETAGTRVQPGLVGMAGCRDTFLQQLNQKFLFKSVKRDLLMQTQKSVFAPLLFLLFSAVLFTAACGKSKDDNTVPGGSNPPASGVWKISYLFSKSDKTDNYSGYTFEFNTDGSLTAVNGGQSWAGTWSTNYDDSANKFCIFFSASVPSALSELEEDWLIIEKNDSFMHFEHTSGGNGNTDVVHFTKQ